MASTRRLSRGLRASVVVMVGGMVTVILIFIASTAYSRWRMATIAQALSVATNGAPSVHFLGLTRTELRRMRTAAEALVFADSPHAVQEMQQARQRLDAALVAELQTPEYPGEGEVARKVLHELASLDRASRELVQHDGRAAFPPEHQQFERVADQLDTQLDELHRLNAWYTRRDASALLDQQQRAAVHVFWVDAVAILLAAMVTLLMVLFVRRYLALLAQRAQELEYFAVQVGHDVFNPLLPIQVSLELFKTVASNDALREAIARSHRSVERLRRASEGLLAFARAGAPPDAGATTTVRAGLESAVGATPSGERISVEAFEDLSVRVASATLDALLRAFFREAAREAGPGGPIGVRVRRAGPRVRVELHLVRNPLQQYPDARELFTPRIRRRDSGYPGIDLELAATRRIVDAHEGDLGADDEGSARILWFELPSA